MAPPGVHRDVPPQNRPRHPPDDGAGVVDHLHEAAGDGALLLPALRGRGLGAGGLALALRLLLARVHLDERAQREAGRPAHLRVGAGQQPGHDVVRLQERKERGSCGDMWHGEEAGARRRTARGGVGGERPSAVKDIPLTAPLLLTPHKDLRQTCSAMAAAQRAGWPSTALPSTRASHLTSSALERRL